MRCRTATITWITYPNYGTFLQAYALQQTLLSLGCTNAIIDDKRIIDSAKRITLRMKIGAIKNKILEFLHLKPKTNPNLHISFYNSFRDKYLNIDSEWTDLKSLSDSYDTFICGSDQIWSPYLKFEPYYYLAFTDKKKIAYAPSTGTGSCNQEYVKNIRPLLESFSHIAVREADGAEMLSAFIEKDIKVVLDPTLLLSSEDWDRVAHPIENDAPYIMCYFLTPNTWYLDYAREYSKKHNVKIKIFNTNPVYQNYGFDCIWAGPSEFLSYIKGADKVFTDSFHASIFSIIYQKDFVTFKRFEDGGTNDQNARIANLFRKLGIESRFIGKERLHDIEHLDELCYTNMNGYIGTLRDESISYLRNALAE